MSREGHLILVCDLLLATLAPALADEGWCAPLLRLLTDPHTLNRASAESNRQRRAKVFRTGLAQNAKNGLVRKLFARALVET
jgi:hypothetical protein